MLRCRRCRKGVIDSTCLVTVEATNESLCTVCSIWHVNFDSLPEWILTSIHQAQWTVGKLNCQTCGARVGGFNFINRSKCPCGRDASVHLNKSRVELDHKPHVLIVQPRRTRPEFSGTSQDRSSGLMDRSASNLTRTGTDGASYSTYQELDRADGEASAHAPVLRSFVSRRRRLRFVSPVETVSVQEDVPDSSLSLRGRTVSDSVAEREEETSVPQAPAASSDSNFQSKRERHRQKRLRRKQRRRERWLNSQLEPVRVHADVIETNVFAESRTHLASKQKEEEEEEEEEDEGLTCGVCLEVYFSPYSCLPCGHVFCEPCLRTLAKNRVTMTPCPLCRTLISNTDFHKDLNQTAMTFFPKVYYAREQIFQSSSCSKWPLPNCSSGFRGFWGYQRQTSTSRSWHAAHGGFALDFTFMRRWLFDFCLVAGLVIVYDVNSAKWILALLFFCFLTYYFFF